MNLEKFYTSVSNKVIDYGPKVIVGIIVYLIGLSVIRFLKSGIRRKMGARKVHSSLQPFFLSLSITALHVLLLIAIMEIIGIQLTIFTAVVGAFGVTAGLALSGTLQNFAGGVLILLLEPFNIDDNIVAQGVDGVVVSIQVFYTEMRTFDNKTVIVPNGKLFNEIITNVTRQGTRRIDIELKLTYAIDVDQVRGAIAAAIPKIRAILTNPAPVIGISALEIDGIKVIMKVWCSTPDYTSTRYALQEQVVKDLKTAGVKLPGT